MKVVAIIVGIDGWANYTGPLMHSFARNNPGIDVVCIDNQSFLPYPRNGQVVRTCERLSYAAALNIGLEIAANQYDWYIVMNNDVSIKKNFTKAIRGMDPHCLHGSAIHHIHVHNGDYLQGWLLFLSQDVIDNVGLFDEKFDVTWFEDVDYSWRALAAGYQLRILDIEGMGFHHYGKERPDWEEFRSEHKDVYESNRKYLLKKHKIKEGNT